MTTWLYLVNVLRIWKETVRLLWLLSGQLDFNTSLQCYIESYPKGLKISYVEIALGPIELHEISKHIYIWPYYFFRLIEKSGSNFKLQLEILNSLFHI